MIPYILMTSVNEVGQGFMDKFTDLVGNPMLIGLMLLIMFIFFMVVLKINFEVGAVVMIPIMFIVSVWIEPLRLIFAVVIGLVIGVGILRLIGRR